MTEKIVMTTDPEAATHRENICGWVSRKGLFFGKDERTARWDGATHIACSECGELITKRSYTVCTVCREKAAVKKYEDLPKTEWNGETPLYSDYLDRFFFDEEDLDNSIEEHGILPDKLRLFLCDGVPHSELEPALYLDDMPEDSELPDELEEAIKIFNEAIKTLPPAYWVSSSVAIKIEE